MMRIVRSDTLEVASGAASGGVRASREVYTLAFACAASVLALLVAIAAGANISASAAAWFGVPTFLALNGYVFWRARFSRLLWVMFCRADRVYVRLFAWRGRDRGDGSGPDVVVFEGSEIVSMGVRTLEVFLHGPKPKVVEWLVIEPAQAVAEEFASRSRSLLEPADPGKAVLLAIEGRRLVIEWKWWRPALQAFLQQVAHECPSTVPIGNGERSKVDLNEIWTGRPLSLMTARQRHMLVEAIRLGFGCKCRRWISQYNYLTLRQSEKYMEELVREEAGSAETAGEEIGRAVTNGTE